MTKVPVRTPLSGLVNRYTSRKTAWNSSKRWQQSYLRAPPSTAKGKEVSMLTRYLYPPADYCTGQHEGMKKAHSCTHREPHLATKRKDALSLQETWVASHGRKQACHRKISCEYFDSFSYESIKFSFYTSEQNGHHQGWESWRGWGRWRRKSTKF